MGDFLETSIKESEQEWETKLEKKIFILAVGGLLEISSIAAV